MLGFIFNYICGIFNPSPEQALKNTQIRDHIEKSKDNWIHFN